MFSVMGFKLGVCDEVTGTFFIVCMFLCVFENMPPVCTVAYQRKLVLACARLFWGSQKSAVTLCNLNLDSFLPDAALPGFAPLCLANVL